MLLSNFLWLQLHVAVNSSSICTKQTFSIKHVECDENETTVSDAPSTSNHDQDSHDSDNDAGSSNSEEVCIQLIFNKYSALHLSSFIHLTRVVLWVIFGALWAADCLPVSLCIDYRILDF